MCLSFPNQLGFPSSPSSRYNAKTTAYSMQTKAMDEMAAVVKRFGDEQSTLLDQFERLSFEVQLNQVILGRSLSEPSVGRSQFSAQPPFLTQSRRGRRGLGFNKILKRLLKPILGSGRKAKGASGGGGGGGGRREVPDPKNPKSWKALSRSVRL